jgi:transcription elongation factor GreA
VSMTDNTAPVTWLTREAYDRLKAELDTLIENRTAISAEISARREEGDLRENGGYHAAREEQGKQEARIRQLQELLRTAQVGEAAVTHSDVAGPGMVVTVRFEDDEESETFLIGSREETGADLEVYSAASPLGKALDGAKVGETRTYETPNGKTMSVTLQKAEPFHE